MLRCISVPGRNHSEHSHWTTPPASPDWCELCGVFCLLCDDMGWDSVESDKIQRNDIKSSVDTISKHQSVRITARCYTPKQRCISNPALLDPLKPIFHPHRCFFSLTFPAAHRSLLPHHHSAPIIFCRTLQRCRVIWSLIL